MKKITVRIFAFLMLCNLCINAQFTALTHFTGKGAFTGTKPQIHQNLIAIGDTLYGMTSAGGLAGGIIMNNGTIFKIRPDGSGFSKLHTFNYYDGAGATSSGSLFYDGTFLYGMTTDNTYGVGKFFKIKPDGTGFAKLFDFPNASSDTFPSGSLISDGYADQFGGPEGRKKMTSKRLKTLLFENVSKPILEQKKNILNYFQDWKGDTTQIDDVLIMGVRLKTKSIPFSVAGNKIA